MYRRFVVEQPIVGNSVLLTGDEHNHAANVMRLKIGDKIIVTCNDEYDYICDVEEISKKTTTCRVVSKAINEHNPSAVIDVFQSLIKNDKMSILVQKLSELGIANLRLFETKFQTVKPSENKKDKLQKISNQSAKQCKRSLFMTVHDAISFCKMLQDLSNYDIVLFANECEESAMLNQICNHLQRDKKIALIIGSEGGFDKSEIDRIIAAGAKSVSLGKRILRAETASIALAGFVSIMLNN